MFEYNVINRKLKIEKNSKRIVIPILKQLQSKVSNKNYSFEFSKEYEKYPSRLRCQSAYSTEFGFRPYKYQLFHDIISEFPEHKKHRLANVIINNLSKFYPQIQEKPNLPSQGSARNIFSKANGGANHNYSSFMKKVKEFKISEQPLATERQYGMSTHENIPLTRQPSLDVEQMFETKQTITLSCSRKQSPKYQMCLSTNQCLLEPQFILKSQFNKKNNVLEKILTEARTQLRSAQSPRSFGMSNHKKTKSNTTNVYAQQNKLLLRAILNLK